MIPDTTRKTKEGAFEKIYDTEWGVCLKIAISIVWPDMEMAKDTVQESFLKLWKNWDEIDFSKGYKPWLYRCVKNQALDYLKKKKPELIDFDKHIQQSVLITQNDTFDLEDLHQKLSILSIKQRRVVLLRFWHGFSIKEIGEILEIPSGTVGSRLVNGLKKLGDHFSKRGDFYG